MAEKNSKGKTQKWEPVELDDPSFFAGEMDGFHFKHMVKLPLYFTRNWEKIIFLNFFVYLFLIITHL